MEPQPQPPKQDQQEALWLQQVARGGSAANAALHSLQLAYNRSRFIPMLWKRGFSKHEREDILQEIWLAVFRSAGTFRPGATPSPWLCRIATNKADDALRQHYRKDMKNVSLDEESAATETAGEAHLSVQPVSRMTGDECVRSALDRFAEKHPEEGLLLFFFHLEGWSLEQVGEYRDSTAHAACEYLRQVRLKFSPFVEHCLDHSSD